MKYRNMYKPREKEGERLREGEREIEKRERERGIKMATENIATETYEEHQTITDT